MIQKIEKVLDLAAEALAVYIYNNARTAAGNDVLKEALGEKKERKPRGPAHGTKTAAAPLPPVEPPANSPFGALGGDAKAEAAPKLSAEDAIEAARRGQEVMGLFIRRYLKASPSGLERAVKTIEDTLGKPRNPAHVHPQTKAMIWRLEEIRPEEWLKLTPIFEAALDDKAQA